MYDILGFGRREVHRRSGVHTKGIEDAATEGAAHGGRGVSLIINHIEGGGG